MHAVGDEARRVIGDLGGDAGGEVGGDLGQAIADLGRRRERVGAGALGDGERDRRPPLQRAGGGVGGGAELHPSDIAEAQQPPAGAGADDDALELQRIGQPAAEGEVGLEGLVGHRRLGDLAARHLGILRLHRGDDVLRGDGVGRHQPGVQPDAHGVVARALHVDVADAVDPQQLVPHLAQRVIGDVELVVAAIRRADEDDHQPVGRQLAGGDAPAPHLLRQARQGGGDGALHQDLRPVRIRAEAEGDGQHHPPIGGGLRGHVEHALGAVDLLLDRRRHRIRHHLRGGAGVGGGDDDGGRRHVRVFRDGQREQREPADDQQDQREDAGEDRLADREDAEIAQGRASAVAAGPGMDPGADPEADPGAGETTAAAVAAMRCGTTAWPARTRVRPLVTTSSLPSRPWRITRMPSCSGPSWTWRICSRSPSATT